MGRQFKVVARNALTVLLLSALGLSVAIADDADPPGRVARLSSAKGSVSLQPAGDQEWSTATLNRPLTIGDKLWTDQDSRAELDLGSAAIRLGSTTGVSFLNLDDQTIQLNVTAGTALVHVRDIADQQNFEIDTPNTAVTLLGPGDYRVEVNDAGDTTVVKVSNGEAEAAAGGQSIPIRNQQAVILTGTDQVSASNDSIGAPDALDQWSLEREHRSQEAQSSQYVSPDMTGAQDLDEYGSWQSDPDYGYVWTPTSVAAGWAPYHYGRWVWVSPWGWTWVDDAPWGFAPFHYGRWAYARSHWCWVPGPRHVRPVYAPALVAWVGGGVAVGAAVGWFALGPREVYVPSYRVSNNYVRNVNVSNTTIINNTYITNVYQNKVSNITYVNRAAPGAVTAVPRNVFTSAQPVAPHASRIPAGDRSRLAVSPRTPAIAPERQSFAGGATAASVRRPPPTLLNRPVVAKQAPPPAPPPIDKQLDAIRANGGRPLARAQLTQLQPRTANPQIRVVGPGAGRTGPTPPNGARAPAAGGAAAGGPAGGAQQRPPAAARGAERPPTASPPAASPPGATARGQSLQDRERALHTTPIPPSESRVAPVQSNSPPTNRTPRAMPPQNAPRNDRPPSATQTPQAHPIESARPPAAELRSAEPQRATPEPRPVPQARPLPQARPIPEAQPESNGRPPNESHARPEARPVVPQARPIESARPPSESRSAEPPRPVPQARPIESARPAPEGRAIAPPPQRAAPEVRAEEPPRAAPPQVRAPAAAPPAQPARQNPPPPRPDDRRKPERS